MTFWLIVLQFEQLQSLISLMAVVKRANISCTELFFKNIIGMAIYTATIVVLTEPIK